MGRFKFLKGEWERRGDGGLGRKGNGRERGYAGEGQREMRQ